MDINSFLWTLLVFLLLLNVVIRLQSRGLSSLPVGVERRGIRGFQRDEEHWLDDL